MCTVDAGETAEAWDVTEIGTRIQGQHWAPCRFGTRWEDKVVEFDVKIESGGASWGVHMVANGLIFCLDVETRSLAAVEGLSNTDGIFPPIPRGGWSLPELDLNAWLKIKILALGDSMVVEIEGQKVATLTDLQLHPILGGNNNSGSIAFGGPAHYTAIYRSLLVKDMREKILYRNDFLLADKARTLADFAVGTNQLACTIDGAKRDRACFSGDLFVMGRSIAYSTARFDAILGSISLLSSHQTSEGYIGNLCPIQAPVHEEVDMEPPTYAFYSLSYALALIVVTREYWMQSGDSTIVKHIWGRFEKLVAFVERFKDERGLIVVPPQFSSKFSFRCECSREKCLTPSSGLATTWWTTFRCIWKDQSRFLRCFKVHEPDEHLHWGQGHVCQPGRRAEKVYRVPLVECRAWHITDD